MLLSIIIPTLNEEKVLEKTLQNLRKYNSDDFEIIVSDGKSTDRTLEIARKYADKVVVYEGQARQNIAGGRNAGAAVARGQFLVFIDADVIIPSIETFFEHAKQFFVEDRRLLALTVFLKVLPEHVTLADKLFFSLVNWQNQLANNLFHIGTSSGEFQMIRAEYFNKLGGYNENMAVGEDVDLFSRLAKIGRTKVATGLHVFHTSRRAHDIGWGKLLFFWWINLLYTKLFKKSFHKVWNEVR